MLHQLKRHDVFTVPQLNQTTSVTISQRKESRPRDRRNRAVSLGVIFTVSRTTLCIIYEIKTETKGI